MTPTLPNKNQVLQDSKVRLAKLAELLFGEYEAYFSSSYQDRAKNPVDLKMFDVYLKAEELLIEVAKIQTTFTKEHSELN